jgi:hypothetical protein
MKSDDKRVCKRCGRVNCDEVPPGYFERLAEKLKSAPAAEGTPDFENEPEPFI